MNKAPDYFLVNTCTVTSGADQKSRNIIRKCIRKNPKAKVIVTGCLVENDWKMLAGIKGVSFIIKKSFFPEGISSFSQHTRAFLKIQDGCSNFCTYCKVALVRGKERSKDLIKIAQEAGKLVASGYKEIVLTGICLGSYGKDLLPIKSLADAVDVLENIDGLIRIRLSSIEAGDISLELIKRLRKSSKFCRHLHIPIQSGDDSILKKMNRKYSPKKYLDLIKDLKKRIPGLCITTDCLVGFPGETDDNFKHTLDLVKRIIPLKVHLFPYSSRPGTKAASLGGVVNSGLVNLRCKQLEAISNECRQKVMRSFLGEKISVLIEERSKDNPRILEGFTDNYLQVKLPFKPGLKGRIVLVKAKKLLGDSIFGEYIDNCRIKCKIKA